MQTLKSCFNRVRWKPTPNIIRVEADDSGFEASWEDGRAKELKWSDVERIFTYKVDCYAYDMIWLAFEERGRDEVIHVREQAEGFPNLMSALGKAFPEIDSEWYFTVMQPAFAENFTILFARKAGAPESPLKPIPQSGSDLR